MTHILTINGGSSSIKFALFRSNSELTRLYTGQFSRIGLPDARFEITNTITHTQEKHTVNAPNHAACIKPLLEWLSPHADLSELQAVGHRIVHGGPKFSAPERITLQVLAELERIQAYAPEHLPAEIALIRAFAEHDSRPLQIACFDTAFHQTLPRRAQILPIPRRYFAHGVRRYGFHGLSYEYLMSELARIAGRDAAHGRVILAHLGNGASMTAVRDGKSVDTTMAFTPTAGLVMSTRTGDLDPGISAYLARADESTPDTVYQILHAQSGLLGISETSSDMRDLLAHEQSDERAADAIAIFCQQAKKFIGAYAAVLGGLDTLVFSGGIGENAPVIRARICDGLQFLGIELDSPRNQANAPVISTDSSRVTVRVIKTDEELQIARSIAKVIVHSNPKGLRRPFGFE